MKLALVLLAALAVATPLPHPDPEAIPEADPAIKSLRCQYGHYSNGKCCCPIL
jgi:hypothetical protein